jgi:tetratricopeptide (TPR) repeat protein
MKARGVMFWLAVAAAPLAAQQQLPVPEAETPLARYVAVAPLPSEQRAELHEAIEKRDYKAAETLLVRAIEASPQEPSLLTLAARVFLADKNPLNAAIALKRADKIRPLGEEDRYNLALAYLGMGRGAWARPELARLEESDQRNPLYPYWLARIDFDEHKYDAAVRRLRALTAQHPEFARAWDNLGLALEGLGQLNEAVSSYRVAVRLNREQKSNSPWPPLNLGTLLTRMGELKEAESLIREALADEPGLAEAHYRLGVNLHKQGEEQAAISALQQATRLDPSKTEPLYTLGQIYREQGNATAAARTFERFRELKKQQR